MARTTFGAPKLPKALLDKVALHAPSLSRGPKLSRKESRKQERLQKKSIQRSQSSPSQPSKRAGADQSQVDRLAKRARLSPASAQPLLSKQEKKKKEEKEQQQQQSAKASSEQVIADRPVVSRAARHALEEDEVEIARLEKKLGIKGKKRSAVFEQDGLNDLLDGADDILGLGKKQNKKKDQEWLENKRKDAVDNGLMSDQSMSGFDGGDGDGDEDEEDEDGEEELLTDDEADTASDVEDISANHGRHELTKSRSDQPARLTGRENPYRPPCTVSETPMPEPSGKKYIPPSLREPTKEDQDVLAQIRRQLQGLLNRLAESNLITVLKDVELVFASNPRQHTITSLIDMIMGLITDRSGLMDSFIMLHAAFVTAVYRSIGGHFGAQLVERIIKDFQLQYQQQAKRYDQAKQTSNLIAFLAELYNFQLINCNLIFGLIRQLVANLAELDAELLLKLIKNCGPQLRHDDPLALKDIVLLVQQAVAAKGGQAQLSVRTGFMLETIINLKNNKIKTALPGSAATSQHVARLKKTINARAGNNVEPLGFSLADLEKADRQGKWWLVGASWSNLPETINETEQVNPANQDPETASTQPASNLLALAKQHRMNTDVRRSIFITIMSAEDYKDAWARLCRLHLNKSQSFEISRILVYLAAAEQTYNPYYRLIAKQMCSQHRYRKSFQFNLYRIFARCGEKDDMAADDESDGHLGADEHEAQIQPREMASLATLYGELIASASLSITVLKILDFLYLHDRTRAFVELLLVTVFRTIQQRCKSEAKAQATIQDIFSQAKSAPDMLPGFQFFLKHHVKSSSLLDSHQDRQALRGNCSVALYAIARAEFNPDPV